MQRIKAVIIEDEIGAQDVLKQMIAQRAPQIEIVGTAQWVNDGIDLIRNARPDLVFLDIQLGNETGFELLEHSDKPSFEVVFVTAYDEFAIRAFEHNALSYLLKPVSIKDFDRVISRASRLLNERSSSTPNPRQILNNRIAIPRSSSIDYIVPEEIEFVKADGSYCEVYFVDGKKIVVSKPLRYIEERVSSPPFFRPHRSYLANARRVKTYDKSDGGSLILESGQSLPISKEGRSVFLELSNRD